MILIIADDAGEVVHVVQTYGSRQRYLLIDDGGTGIRGRLGIGNGGGASAGVAAAGQSAAAHVPVVRSVDQCNLNIIAGHCSRQAGGHIGSGNGDLSLGIGTLYRPSGEPLSAAAWSGTLGCPAGSLSTVGISATLYECRSSLLCSCPCRSRCRQSSSYIPR